MTERHRFYSPKEIVRKAIKNPKDTAMRAAQIVGTIGLILTSSDSISSFVQDRRNGNEIHRQVNEAFPRRVSSDQLKEAESRIRDLDTGKLHNLVDPATGIVRAPENVVQSINLVNQEDKRSQQASKLEAALTNESRSKNPLHPTRNLLLVLGFDVLILNYSLIKMGTSIINRIRSNQKSNSPKPTNS